MVKTHVVVDGSNIATEGRTAPSLEQLDEAVTAFIAEHPDSEVTVVVDATFGHRIDEKEKPEYEEAILAGELVTPPAGAIGRGDAFVLQIADKASATVLSNDSFQEFHGTYDWLFDDGRLIGGKPVRNVGWVFVMRAPVRGPTSRRATRAVRTAKSTPSRPRKDDTSSSTTTTTTAAPPGRKRASRAKKSSDQPVPTASDAVVAPVESAVAASSASQKGRRRRGGGKSSEPINELGPFLAFVEAHPVGSTTSGEVDRFSSHGAYAVVDGALCYIPLKSMGDPPPAKAREVLTLGEVRAFEVTSFDSQRRGIDVALAEPGVAAAGVAAAPQGQDSELPHQPTAQEAVPTMAPVKKKAAAKKAPAKKKAVAKKTVAKKTVTKRAPAKKTVAKKTVAKRAPAKKTVAKKTVAKRAPAKKTVAKKTVAKRAPAKKTVAKKTTAKKAPAKKATARKAPAKRVAKKS